MKKTWYNGSIKEDDKVICIKAASRTNTSALIPRPAIKNTQYEVANGCMYLGPIHDDYSIGIAPILGDLEPMPSPEWFSSHFALLT